VSVPAIFLSCYCTMKVFAATVVMFAEVQGQLPGPGPNGLALTPPMGWMSWEVFRCHIDHTLFEQMTDRLVEDGYLAAGYDTVSVDDCWMNHSRDDGGHVIPNPKRFPAGMKALGDYMHSKGVRFGTYSDAGTMTCEKGPGMKGHEVDDANTFASWGVDYLKLDGCNNNHSNFPIDYPAAGSALQESGRNITYSCSWPAYIGSNETTKPFDAMIAAGCNLWRNWRDIQCTWDSLAAIIDHWGDYSEVMQQSAGPGHWHDPDMLLIGNDCISIEQQKTQMAIWSISASPLIMGNDLRNISNESKAILLNKDAIAVDQDPLGKMGIRHPAYNSSSPTQMWYRELSNGDIAVVLYFASAPCAEWNKTEGGYLQSCSKHIGGFQNLPLAQAQNTCCEIPDCVGITFKGGYIGSGDFQKDQDCGMKNSSREIGYTKLSPHKVDSTDIALDLTELGFAQGEEVSVYDIWLQKDVGSFAGTYVAKNIPLHGTAFLRLSRHIYV